MKMSVRNHPILNKWLTSKQMPHALLLVGGLLSTKLTYAFELAQWLLCEREGACQHCAACQWVMQRAHPDMLWFPCEDEASIKIDDIRAAISHLNQSTHQGKYKIVMLAPAEAMPHAAMNSLLKILEEPPANSLLLLLSQFPSLLSPTIRSRCQRVVFSAENVGDEVMNIKLSQTLQALSDKKLTPFQAAEQWQKVALNEVLQGLYFCSVKIINNGVIRSGAKIFSWFDLINKARSQLLHKLNPNHLMVLENIFYQWNCIHDAS